MTALSTNATATLAAFAANLKTADIPPSVLRKAEDLWVDWFGSAIAGHGSRPVETLTSFALRMGPVTGPSEVFTNRSSSRCALEVQHQAAALSAYAQRCARARLLH